MHDANACENYIAIILRWQSPCFQMYANTSVYCNTVALLLFICHKNAIEKPREICMETGSTSSATKVIAMFTRERGSPEANSSLSTSNLLLSYLILKYFILTTTPIIAHHAPESSQTTECYCQLVKTKICPIHYFRSIYATIKKYVPNDLVKLTVTSVVFGFHIIAIVFVCWLRQFWHFHAVATEQFNFNCCQNTKFVPSTILLEFILQERMIH